MSDLAVPQSASDDAEFAGDSDHFRWGPLALCAACLFVEGYDGQFMGYVVPGIAADWHIAPGALGPALGAGLYGLMLGAFLVAPIADLYGRKRVVVGSVLAFGILTIATMTVHTITALAVLRFFTGLGLGGAMPNTIALTAEFSPPARRASAVTINFASFSVGAAVGGLITAKLMPSYGWGSVFVFCGALALALFPLLLFGLPESYRPKRVERMLPIRELFRDGRAGITALLWFLFFLNLMELYFLTSWLPTTISSQGISIQWAVIATSLLQVGGVAGAFVLGPLVDRYGPGLVLGSAFATGALSVILIGFAGSSVTVTLVAASLCGIGTIGAQNCNNGVAAKFYPAAARATGVGWALAVGRIGSIFGALIGGVLLTMGMDNRTLFLVAAVPPLCAALAYVSMGRQPGLRPSTA
jgi:AAHS family 4-hydroxybenzoate transporter-like MFS transporter